MNPHRTYKELDDAPVTDGDLEFVRVNARLDPAQLGPGEAAMAINMRFDEGRGATRKGIRIMPWGAPGVQYDDPGLVRPYEGVAIAEAYQDPYEGTEWLILPAAAGVYRTRPGTRGVLLPFPAGESPASATDLIQTYFGMVMLRGPAEDPLYMPTLAEGWMTMPPADSGKETVPPSSSGIYFQNRLCVIDGRADPEHVDTVWVSDVGAAGSVLQGPTVYQSFRINQGASDRLTCLAKFNETTLVCGKSRSIYVVSDIYGTNDAISQNARLQEVTRQYGCVSPQSWVQVGADLWFMGFRRGVCSLRQTETNALQGVDVPVSRDIQPLIDRINWQAASGICAAAHENRVYFAVPLDQSASNNAVLVYSTLTQGWAGYDQSDATEVLSFVKFSYAGAVRLGFVNASGFVCLYEDGFSDWIGDEFGNITAQPIEALLRTRGYMGKYPGRKRFKRLAARVSGWNPSYSVTLRSGSAFEAVPRATVTKSRTRYTRPHGTPDWDDSNVLGDWETPYREDYSVEAAGLQVTNALGAGTVKFDQLQEAEEDWRISGRQGQFVQVEFASTQGRVEVSSVTVDTLRGASRRGAKV